VAIASGAVQQKDGIVDMSIGAAVRLPKCEVVQAELRNGLARAEVEVFNDVDVVFGGPLRGMWILGDGGDVAGENKAGYGCETHDLVSFCEISLIEIEELD
jgi:hypothetical protein